MTCYLWIWDPIMPAGAPQNVAAHCPGCGCTLIDRMARQGVLDSLFKLLGLYPFQCRRCGQRFHLSQRDVSQQDAS
jgi:hypothetical protein